jgi:hypothetical protein
MKFREYCRLRENSTKLIGNTQDDQDHQATNQWLYDLSRKVQELDKKLTSFLEKIPKLGPHASSISAIQAHCEQVVGLIHEALGNEHNLQTAFDKLINACTSFSLTDPSLGRVSQVIMNFGHSFNTYRSAIQALVNRSKGQE